MTTLDIERPHFVARGVVLIVMGTFIIAAQDSMIKIFSDRISLWQLLALRGLIAIPLFLLFAWGQNAHKTLFADLLKPWALLRSFCITMTLMLFYAAIPFSQISTIGAVIYLAPIFITLLSTFAINEPVGRLGWVGVVMGFAGVLVLLQPGTDAFSNWTLLPLAGACFYATAHIITRTKCQDITSSSMALSLNLVMMAMGFIMTTLVLVLPLGGDLVQAHPYIFDTWSLLGADVWFALLFLAALSVLINFLIASAYQSAPPSIVATFEYTFLPFAAMWDVLFFGTPLTTATLIGMAMIASAGLLVLKR